MPSGARRRTRARFARSSSAICMRARPSRARASSWDLLRHYPRLLDAIGDARSEVTVADHVDVRERREALRERAHPREVADLGLGARLDMTKDAREHGLPEAAHQRCELAPCGRYERVV